MHLEAVLLIPLGIVLILAQFIAVMYAARFVEWILGGINEPD